VEPQDLQLRFFHAVKSLPRSALARFTQIDYDREMAFIAAARDGDGGEETLGVARAIADPDRIRAEFAILVRSDLKGRGLGALLMKKIIRYCRDREIGEVVGDVLATNERMLALARDLGFEIASSEDPQTLRVRLPLAATPAAPPATERARLRGP
jgi:acetyltransferase